MPICHDCLGGLNGQRNGQLQLMTGEWTATGFAPIVKVADVTRSLAWFEHAGFGTWFHDDTYALAHRDRDLTIHFAQIVRDESPGHDVLYSHCQDAERVARRVEGVRGTRSTARGTRDEGRGTRDEDYGTREGSITDPEGNGIRFESPVR
jgi:hypothetical protein